MCLRSEIGSDLVLKTQICVYVFLPGYLSIRGLYCPFTTCMLTLFQKAGFVLLDDGTLNVVRDQAGSRAATTYCRISSPSSAAGQVTC